MPGLEQKLRDVFISYSSDDYSLVSRVNDVLRQRGLESFFDKLDLLPGENWFDELNEKLALSRVTVIFLTRTALESQWVKFESQKALKRAIVDKTRHVIPVLLQDVQADELPDFLELQQALDLTAHNTNSEKDIILIGLEIAKRVFSLLPDAGLPIPFVVFAMNKQEAKDLVSGKALKYAAREDREMFDYISQKLDYPKEEIPDNYDESRDWWRPPFYPFDEGKTTEGKMLRKSVRQTIDDVIGLINEQAREENPLFPAVYPQFFSEDFLSDDKQTRLNTYEFLKKRRFVLIIDSLSLLHPTLNKRFLVESGFGQSNYKTVRVVVPPPQREVLLPVSRDIEQALGGMLVNLYNRFDTYLDTLYEFGICNERGLRRWIFSSLEFEVAKSIMKAERPEVEARKSFRDEVRR
jgi:hypothetical protein